MGRPVCPLGDARLRLWSSPLCPMCGTSAYTQRTDDKEHAREPQEGSSSVATRHFEMRPKYPQAANSLLLTICGI